MKCIYLTPKYDISQLLNMEKLQKEHQVNLLARHGSIIIHGIFIVTSGFPHKLYAQ